MEPIMNNHDISNRDERWDKVARTLAPSIRKRIIEIWAMEVESSVRFA